MTALLADRWALRCGEPTHLWHGRVFMTCAEQTPLTAYLNETSATCFELVDLAAVEVPDADR
ncbi:hypothetical protein Cme02nite_38570 [Catellatospora methionotrophica]|uniref:Uncharacterized protein n=1 Tax=Catellatospora methionotrophica TaxID=121620 RepID=A0A8J3LMS9_9ACTN|nr:hypothetical protein [Catellatospora methionotrophica]GIG15525.1 hypothetical protein Cme02nite_38570 [Catellatospora methionotrophica]